MVFKQIYQHFNDKKIMKKVLIQRFFVIFIAHEIKKIKITLKKNFFVNIRACKVIAQQKEKLNES